MKTITVVNFIAVIIVVFACNRGLFNRKMTKGGAATTTGEPAIPMDRMEDGTHLAAAAKSSNGYQLMEDANGRPSGDIHAKGGEIPAGNDLPKTSQIAGNSETTLTDDVTGPDPQGDGGFDSDDYDDFIPLEYFEQQRDGDTDDDDTSDENFDRGNYDPKTDPVPSANAVLVYGKTMCPAHFLPKPGDEAKEEYYSNVFVTMASCIVYGIAKGVNSGFIYKEKKDFELQLTNNKDMKNFIHRWLPCQYYDPDNSELYKHTLSIHTYNIAVVIMKHPIPVKKGTKLLYITDTRNEDWMGEEKTKEFINEGFNRMKSK